VKVSHASFKVELTEERGEGSEKIVGQAGAAGDLSRQRGDDLLFLFLPNNRPAELSRDLAALGAVCRHPQGRSIRFD
jgi:hypothetical protein